MERTNTEKLRPGQACPCADCPGVLVTYSTRINFALGLRFRYFRCPECNRDQTRGKFTLPLKFSPSRTNTSKRAS